MEAPSCRVYFNNKTPVSLFWLKRTFSCSPSRVEHIVVKLNSSSLLCLSSTPSRPCTLLMKLVSLLATRLAVFISLSSIFFLACCRNISLCQAIQRRGWRFRQSWSLSPPYCLLLVADLILVLIAGLILIASCILKVLLTAATVDSIGRKRPALVEVSHLWAKHIIL